ncbi:hypothetical protein GKZ90_0014440 [Flavobacterium sp. MC2016-06]|uniref:hypothetical protein n=1 Tax=Flavobacterium sp. MC2016-06 TaxID=2676308 RepID=UPI0012BA670F|nr:hypothetical protein [Flavobacterium sp. MC2016-06]MBU3859217.1 hypothetical protein [Flavobacterium sp. MC2016-06]
MFVLFKKRELSEFISDTFTFFKTFGKHYFKNYFIINGGFLLILCVLMYFFFKVYFEVLFASGTGNGDYFLQYFNNNSTIFISSLVFFGLMIIVLSLLNVAFPILYLQLLDEKNGNDFNTSDLLVLLKQNVGRLLLFFLGCLFVVLPLMVLLFSLLVFLCFILIGIPLIMIAGPAFIAWMHLSFYTYLTEKTSFFTALKIGFDLVKQRFWHITATTLIMLILIQMVQSFITMIPYAIGMVLFFTSADFKSNTNSSDYFSSIGIFITVIFVVAVILSYLFNNLVIINQGIIYYSLREENENQTTISEIDLIGTHNE